MESPYRGESEQYGPEKPRGRVFVWPSSMSMEHRARAWEMEELLVASSWYDQFYGAAQDWQGDAWRNYGKEGIFNCVVASAFSSYLHSCPVILEAARIWLEIAETRWAARACGRKAWYLESNVKMVREDIERRDYYNANPGATYYPGDL